MAGAGNWECREAQAGQLRSTTTHRVERGCTRPDRSREKRVSTEEQSLHQRAVLLPLHGLLRAHESSGGNFEGRRGREETTAQTQACAVCCAALALKGTCHEARSLHVFCVNSAVETLLCSSALRCSLVPLPCAAACTSRPCQAPFTAQHTPQL